MTLLEVCHENIDRQIKHKTQQTFYSTHNTILILLIFKQSITSRGNAAIDTKLCTVQAQADWWLEAA